MFSLSSFLTIFKNIYLQLGTILFASYKFTLWYFMIHSSNDVLI